MRRVLIFIVICLSYFLTRMSFAFEAPVAKYYHASTITTHQSFLANKSIPEILDLLKSLDPQLKIIVLDLPIVAQGLAAEPIAWIDESVTEGEYKFYYDYTAARIESVGFYLAQGLEIESYQRPNSNHSILMLKLTAPKHVVLHEALHFLIDLSQRKFGRKVIMSMGEGFELMDQVVEEVFVDSYILSRLEGSLPKKDLCFRRSYLQQNLQVFGYHLREGDLSEIQPSFKKVLYRFYQQASSISDENRLECLLLKYSEF